MNCADCGREISDLSEDGWRMADDRLVCNTCCEAALDRLIRQQKRRQGKKAPKRPQERSKAAGSGKDRGRTENGGKVAKNAKQDRQHE